MRADKSVSFQNQSFYANIAPGELWQLPVAQVRKLFRLMGAGCEPAALRRCGDLIASALQIARADYLGMEPEEAENKTHFKMRQTALKRQCDRLKKIYDIYLEEYL